MIHEHFSDHLDESYYRIVGQEFHHEAVIPATIQYEGVIFLGKGLENKKVCNNCMAVFAIYSNSTVQ